MASQTPCVFPRRVKGVAKSHIARDVPVIETGPQDSGSAAMNGPTFGNQLSIQREKIANAAELSNAAIH